MPILGIAYVTIGAVIGYNAYREVQHGRFAIDMIAASIGEDNLLSPESIRLLADAALLGITTFSTVAWPVVILYDEAEKAITSLRLGRKT